VAVFTAAAIFAVCNRIRGSLRSAQHYKGYSASSKILLVLDIFVSGEKNIECGPFGFG
jgi:hypothetical protein